jgi:uncharacterized membrane protein
MNALAHKPSTIVTVILLILIAIAHVLRLVFHTTVMVSATAVPAWVSVAAIIIPLALAYWLWLENRG